MLVLVACIAFGWRLLMASNAAPRGQALQAALAPIAEDKDPDKAVVAKVILESYRETRANAARWSGVYWLCTFAAAILSALAGLVLKFESLFKEKEALRKDLAAVFSVAAALLITISTSGDFQRKWQANRIAAAELEKTGFQFLQGGTTNVLSYLGTVSETLMQRHVSIVGAGDGRNKHEAPTDPSPAKQQ